MVNSRIFVLILFFQSRPPILNDGGSIREGDKLRIYSHMQYVLGILNLFITLLFGVLSIRMYVK